MTAAPRVEMKSLRGLADLVRLEGPWLDGLANGDHYQQTIDGGNGAGLPECRGVLNAG